jgi:hypothetical protein
VPLEDDDQLVYGFNESRSPSPSLSQDSNPFQASILLETEARFSEDEEDWLDDFFEGVGIELDEELGEDLGKELIEELEEELEGELEEGQVQIEEEEEENQEEEEDVAEMTPEA